jgi:diacylglycerol O-acyltransferase
MEAQGPRRMDPLEAGFYYSEDEHLLLHVGGIAVFDGRIDFAALVERIEQRIADLPGLRQVVVPLPFEVARPSWGDDPHFDLLSHMRRFEVPPPGSDHELREAVSEFWSWPLDRKKPLWDLTLLEGLEGGRSALLFKAHRAALGPRGIARFAQLFLDDHPVVHDAAKPPPFRPRPSAGAVVRVAEALVDQLTALPRRVTAAALQLLDRQAMLSSVTRLGSLLESVATLLSTPAPETPINGPLGEKRRLGWVRLSLDVVRGIESTLGGTLDDALLTIVADALGRYLRSRGRPTDDLHLTSLVEPLGGSAPDAHLLASLPVGALSPAARHAAVRSGGTPGGQHRLDGLDAIASLLATLPGGLRRALSSLAFQAVNTICIDLPALHGPLYATGQRLRFIVPIVPLTWNVGLSFCVLAYAESEIVIGIQADAGHVPDLTPLESALQEAYLDLAATAGVPAIDPSRATA